MPLPDSHSLRNSELCRRVRAGRSRTLPVTGIIVGGGFALGLLCGAVLIFGGSEEPRPSKRAEVVPAAPQTVAHQQEAAESVDENLSGERDRLKQELDKARLEWEVAELRRQLASVKKPSAAVDESPVVATSPVSTQRDDVRGHQPTTAASDGPTGRPTLEYWNEMNAVIAQEARMRATPAGGIASAGIAGSFLDARIRAAEFASQCILDLDPTGVDPAVTTLAQHLIEWYQEARSVAETGRSLMEQGNPQQRQGSAGQQYQDAERRHAKNVDTVNAEGEQVRRSMSKTYRLEFPPLN